MSSEEQFVVRFLKGALWLWLASLLISLLPVSREHEFLFGIRAGGLVGAFQVSWMAAGVSIWAAIRSRRRKIVICALISTLLAAVSTAYAYYWVFIRHLAAGSR